MRNRIVFFTTWGLLIHPGGGILSQTMHWSSRGVGGGGSLYSPNINPANNDEFYVGCDMSGLYHTTDFGSSYSLMDFRQIQGGHDSRVQYTQDPKILYCVPYANDLALPVRSTDGGKSWSTLPGNPDPSETTYSIAVDFNNPDRVIISWYGSILASTDGGKSFATVHTARNSGSGVTVGGAFFDGNSVYLGTSDGLFVSTNGGASFGVAPVGGLGGAERIFSFAGAKKGNTLRFFCLTADSGNIYVGVPGSDYWGFLKGVYSLDFGLANWTPRMTGINAGTDYLMYVAMAQNDTAIAYLGGSNSSGVPNIMKTTNGGVLWTHVFLSSGNQNVSTGWSGDGGDRGWGFGECVFGLAVAPNNAGRMYASVVQSTLGGVYVTNDLQDGAASVWAKLPSPPRTEGHPASLVVLKDGSLVCTFSGRRTAAGFTPSSGVFVYSSGSGTWTDVSDPGMRYWTKDIVVDPADSTQKKLYVGVFSGWGGPPNGLGGLYRTTNRGVSWTKISTLDRVTTCAINPSNPSEAYLTTETNGLWHTAALTAPSPSFTLDATFPFRQPERVYFNPYAPGEVWVASFGGGIIVGRPVSSVIGGDRQEIPSGYFLGQNYPNPFNPATTIRYALPRGSHVVFSLNTMLGQRAAELVNRAEGPGVHEVKLDATNLASGVYIYTLRAGDFIQSKKLVLIH